MLIRDDAPEQRLGVRRAGRSTAEPGVGADQQRRAAAPLLTGLRWEEAVAVPIGNVSLAGQCMKKSTGPPASRAGAGTYART